MASSRQPQWASPQGPTAWPDLKVYNSLTRSKVTFVPREKQKITWYSCGPTVYDDAHLGHARNYVTIDILRRIFRDYFQFDVHFVMNITDVDDKIILRGRQRHLYEEYQTAHRYIDTSVLQDVLKSWHLYIRKNLPRIPQEPAPEPSHFAYDVKSAYCDVLDGKALEPDTKPGDKEAKIRMHIRTAENTAKALLSDLKTMTPTAFYELASDSMCTMLDADLGNTIKGSDHHIFAKLTQEYEDRFFHDMRDLNVLDPDDLVRVTEYGADIASFVERIANNKFAYSTPDGSVYFDIQAFEKAGFPYARLEPWNRGDKDLQADGEGALSQQTKGKRSDADFALWKASKPGEPSWGSPWGPGRPGWHIECSAMASAKLGKQMDIHSGGIDLAFPHHDNELAQSEAFWSSEGKSVQWVNYFLHMGHLSIQGSKMSKSLKNFTTIRKALEDRQWTPRSLRVVFLLGAWKDGIEITDDMVKAGMSWEDRVDNFFLKTREAIHCGAPTSDGTSVLAPALAAADQKVRNALLDSFNTPEAMSAISALINEYNSANRSDLTLQDSRDTGLFVTRMVNIFGLNGNAPADTQEVGWEGIEIPEAAKEFVYPLSKMRDQLRQAAKAKDVSTQRVQEIVASTPEHEDPEVHGQRRRPSYARAYTEFRSSVLSICSTQPAHMNQEILALCDRVRNVDLWNLDIYLEDRADQDALVRPVTEGLRAARREREDQVRSKDEAKKKRDQEAQEKLEKGRMKPEEMFRPPNMDDYSQWDNEGLPTRTKNGEPVASSKLKRLRKDWERQKKAHEAFLQAVQKGMVNTR